MNSTASGHSPGRRSLRRFASGVTSVGLAVAGLATVGLASAAPAQADEAAITNAELRWSISTESLSAAYAPGAWNLFSAGKLANPGEGSQMLNQADSGATWLNGTTAGWKNTAGNVVIEDKAADGSYAPTTFLGTRQNSAGQTTNTSSINSENVLSLRNGTGTVDAAANTGTIAWDGDFTVVYYSGMSFFYVSDPELTVDADGTGELTATLSGYGSDMEDMEQWNALPETEVTLADLQGVELTDAGLTVTPDYLGVEYDAGTGAPQSRTGAHWGSFPKSFVDFQVAVGTPSYWYSSGGGADVRKPATPLTVNWSPPAPAVPAVAVSDTTLLPNGAQEVTVTGTGFDPDAAIGTRPPLAGKTGGAYVVFGKFAENWRPSASAPGANRVNSNQKWAVLADDMATIGGPEAGAVELTPEGSFSATVTVDKTALDTLVDSKANATDLVNYGIYTYPGSGATSAGYETYTPITFAKTTAAVKATAAKSAFGKAGRVNVTVTSAAVVDGSVTITEGTRKFGTATVLNGQASVPTPKTLKAGGHQLTVTYSGNANIAPATKTVKFTVVKAKASVKVKVLAKPKPTKAGKFRVSVKAKNARATGKVVVKVRNARGKVVKTVKGKVRPNGIVTLKLPKLAKGAYRLDTRYAGNANIKVASKNKVKLRVTK